MQERPIINAFLVPDILGAPAASDVGLHICARKEWVNGRRKITPPVSLPPNVNEERRILKAFVAPAKLGTPDAQALGIDR
jgi:hypothetical protein